jgi:SAM-dependent methyltransferase
MERMLDGLRAFVTDSAPNLLPMFEIYAEEARFGRALIDRDLRRLQTGARLLEIGAGSLMLSCTLTREGYDVTALEPIAPGFSHFTRLQQVVLDYAEQTGGAPEVMRCPAETLDIDDRFAFAFSVNVMEHVGDIARTLKATHRALKAGGTHRFVCPNYAFPYEPHFNMPTLFSRALTMRVFRQRILASPAAADPAALWSSLNWIAVRDVRRICRALAIRPSFRADIFDLYLERVSSDPVFRKRRGRVLNAFIGGLRRSGLMGFARLIPIGILPVMDCSIVKEN